MRSIISRLDPISWHEVVFWAVVASTMVGWRVLIELDIFVPGWIVIPLVGVLFWRAEGVRWRDVRVTVVPIAAAFFLADYLVPPSYTLIVEFAILGAAGAMFLVPRFKRAWLGFIAPGHYRVLSPGDEKIADKFHDLALAFGRAQERATRTQDFERFGHSLSESRDRVDRLQVPDDQWEEVRRLWVRYLDWFVETEADAIATDTETEELTRRGRAFIGAFRSLRDRRSYYLGRGPNSRPSD